MILFWISISLCALSLASFFYFFYKFRKDRKLTKFSRTNLLQFVIPIGTFVVFSLMSSFGIKMWNQFDMSVPHLLMMIFGSIFCSLGIAVLIESFTLYYFKNNIDSNIRKYIKIAMFVSIPVAIIFFILAIDSYSYYANFPLISGMTFTSEGIKFNIQGSTQGGFTLNWYGIIILAGAVISYLIADRHFYLEYKKHGIIDTFFVLVFIVGIFGARLWAVYILPSEKGVDFWNFQSGGLGIMGGVFFGSVAGIIFLLIFRRYINLRHAIDMILPCVLVAQAIGRWGNFFNQEVYGYMTLNPDTVWWLPHFIVRQMTIHGAIHLPLFLIECIMNLAGYFLIVYGVGKGLKKHISHGDLFFLYLVWYGMTRVILEPLREQTFENLESVITAWAMFGGGLAGILGLHLYDYFRWGKRTFDIKNQQLIVNNKHRNPYIVNINEPENAKVEH